MVSSSGGAKQCLAPTVAIQMMNAEIKNIFELTDRLPSKKQVETLPNLDLVLIEQTVSTESYH